MAPILVMAAAQMAVVLEQGLQNGFEKQDITLNDLICFCVIKAIKKFPEINSHFLDDRIKVFNKVHLGIAVDTTRGLMVPALKNADDLNLAELSRELKSAADSCKKGNIFKIRTWATILK